MAAEAGVDLQSVIDQASEDKVRAATIIASRQRARITVQQYDPTRAAAIKIQEKWREQQRERALLAQCQYEEETPERINALRLVTTLLAMQEDAQTAKAIAFKYLACEFVDEHDMPGNYIRTMGTGDYLKRRFAGHTGLRAASTVYIPPRVQRVSVSGRGKERVTTVVVEYEACFANRLDLRIEYHVQQRRLRDPRLAKRRVAPMAPLSRPETSTVDVKRGGITKGLRESFEALDADRSGHLSVEEITKATALVGLRLNPRALAKQLLLASTDGDTQFEMHELDAVLRQERELREAGIEEFSRPVVFGVLPLAARAFDAHQVVARSIKNAEERALMMEKAERKAARRMQLMKRRLEKTPGLVAAQAIERLMKTSRTSNQRLLPTKPNFNQQPAPLAKLSMLAKLAPITSQLKSRVVEHREATGPSSNKRLPELPAIPASISSPELGRLRLLKLAGAPIPRERTRGLQPVPTKSGLLPPLPLQTQSEKSSAFMLAKRSHDPLSMRLAARQRTPFGP